MMEEPTWPLGEGKNWASPQLTTRVPVVKACSEWHQCLREFNPKVCHHDIGAGWPKWLKKEECWRVDLTVGGYSSDGPALVILLIYPTGKAKLRFLNAAGAEGHEPMMYYPHTPYKDTKQGMIEAFAVACSKEWLKAVTDHLVKSTEPEAA